MKLIVKKPLNKSDKNQEKFTFDITYFKKGVRICYEYYLFNLESIINLLKLNGCNEIINIELDTKNKQVCVNKFIPELFYSVHNEYVKKFCN